MTDSASLALLQRDFAGSVARLDGTAVDGADVLGQLRSDRGIPAALRLRVYEDAYFARIHGVLSEDFGALHSAIGDDAFHDLVKLYLMANPPRSFSLRFAGDRLPDFLSGPIAEAFSRRWPFAADLAALEWAIADVFDAPDAAALERTELERVLPEEWAGLRFALVPAARLLSLDWPVHRLVDAWSAGVPMPVVEASPTSILVYRHDERVRRRPLSAAEAGALSLIASNHDFATICEAVAEATSESEGVARVLRMLETWLAEGILATHVESENGRRRRSG